MATYLSAYRHFKSIIGDQVFVVSGYEPDWEGSGGSNWTVLVKGFRAVWGEVVRDCRSNYRPPADELIRYAIEDVKRALVDVYEAFKVETENEYQARRTDEQRRELERTASGIAQRYGVEAGTMDFIKACESELERFQDYRQGLREDGLCIGYGVTYEQWADEFNCSVWDSDAIYKILEWVKTECPLLWSKYLESKLTSEQLKG
jgi:hypothetical protein